MHPIHDDPAVKMQRWEERQAQKAGLTVEAWRERERQDREVEKARTQGRVGDRAGPEQAKK